MDKIESNYVEISSFSSNTLKYPQTLSFQFCFEFFILVILDKKASFSFQFPCNAKFTRNISIKFAP